MNWRELINGQIRFDAKLSDSGGTTGEPTFLTVSALVTFSGASSALAVLRAVIRHVWPALEAVRGIGFGLALLIAFVIWLIGITDPSVKMSRRDKAIGLLLALLNACTLYAASEGLLYQFNPSGNR